VKYALGRLNEMLERAGKKRESYPKLTDYKPFPEWYGEINDWKEKYPFYFEDTEEVIQPQHAIQLLWQMTKGDAIITTGVGQHQMWAGQFFDYDRPRTFITSAGLGSMGFGYPAAIGAKIACPDKEVVDIDGDGSFLMNVQELALAHIEGIAAKAMILNNQWLGMVVQWEDRFYNSNRGHTFLGDPKNLERIYPDYLKICEGFGVPCERVIYKKDLPGAIKRMLESKEAYVLDVMVPNTEHVMPMIPSGASYKDVIYQGRQTLEARGGL
jgi:acetolactate synthase I/II/III large subunit